MVATAAGWKVVAHLARRALYEQQLDRTQVVGLVQGASGIRASSGRPPPVKTRQAVVAAKTMWVATMSTPGLWRLIHRR